MARFGRMRNVLELFDMVGSAVRVASASQTRHRANPRDLARLGIDPEQFNKIHGM